MAEKRKLVKVQFWTNEEFRKEINDFAHSINLSGSDLYKAGAIMLKDIISGAREVNINLFTRSFKEFEDGQIKKKIQKAYKDSRSVY